MTHLLEAVRVKPSSVQRLYEFAICVPVFYPLFNYFWLLCFERLGLPGAGAVDTLLLVLESGLLLIASLFSLLAYPSRVVLPYLVVFVLAGASVLATPGVLPFLLGSSKSLLVFCIPVIFLVLNVRDYERLLMLLIRASYIVGTMGIIVGVLMPKSTYSMWYSYALLPALTFITIKQFLRYRVYDSVLIIILLLCVFSYGSRGALLGFGVSLLLLLTWRIVINRRVLLQHRGIAQGGLAIAAVFAVAGMVILWLWPGSSRLQSAIRAGGIFYDSGRSEIYGYVVGLIVEHPFGVGLHGERVASAATAGQWFEGEYAHNLFLEVLAHFGVIPGVLAFGIWAIALVSLLKTNRNPYLLLLLISSFSVGFVQSLFSGTYLTNTPLWLFMAVTISGNMRKEGLFRAKANQPEAHLPLLSG